MKKKQCWPDCRCCEPREWERGNGKEEEVLPLFVCEPKMKKKNLDDFFFSFCRWFLFCRVLLS